MQAQIEQCIRLAEADLSLYRSQFYVTGLLLDLVNAVTQYLPAGSLMHHFEKHLLLLSNRNKASLVSALLYNNNQKPLVVEFTRLALDVMDEKIPVSLLTRHETRGLDLTTFFHWASVCNRIRCYTGRTHTCFCDDPLTHEVLSRLISG